MVGPNAPIPGAQPFRWFTDADVRKETVETCSLCGQPLPSDDDWECADDTLIQVPILLFRQRSGEIDVARFHWACFEQLRKSGVLKLSETKP